MKVKVRGGRRKLINNGGYERRNKNKKR